MCEINYYGLLTSIVIPVLAILVSMIIAKKQIINAGVTQFRQQWIDNLRNSISEYLSAVDTIIFYSIYVDPHFNEKQSENFRNLKLKHYKVLLLINPLEVDHKKIVEYLNEISNLINTPDKINQKSIKEKTDQLINDLQKILKREWEVVKKGK